MKNVPPVRVVIYMYEVSMVNPIEKYGILYKYLMLKREMVQNIFPRDCRPWTYYFPETEGRGEIVGPRSTVYEGIYFAPFHE